MRDCVSLILILSVAFSCMVFAQEGLTPEQEKRIQDLEKLVEKQHQKIQELQSQIGTTKEETKEYTEKIVQEYLDNNSAEETGITAGYDKGFFIKSADGNFKWVLTGFLQVYLGIYENNTWENNGFEFNGVYLTNDIYLYDQWHARIQIDFAGAQAPDYEPRLRDAYIEYIAIPEFNVRVGQTHVPFTIEGQFGPNEGMSIFAEPFITTWSHGRDIGIMFLGDICDYFEYRVGVFNGEGHNTVNQTDDVLMAAQARIYFMKRSENPLTFFHVGVIRSRDHNLHPTGDFSAATMATPWGRILYGDNSGPGGLNDDNTEGWRSAVDTGISFNYKGLWILSEFMYSQWARKYDEINGGRLAPLWGWGASFGVSYKINLTGEEDGSGLIPKFKFSYTDLDNSQTDNALGQVDGQSIFCYTVGLGYAFNEHIALDFNWVMVNARRRDVIGPKGDLGNPFEDHSDDLEHGWFFQITAQW